MLRAAHVTYGVATTARVDKVTPSNVCAHELQYEMLDYISQCTCHKDKRPPFLYDSARCVALTTTPDWKAKRFLGRRRQSCARKAVFAHVMDDMTIHMHVMRLQPGTANSKNT